MGLFVTNADVLNPSYSSDVVYMRHHVLGKLSFVC